MTEVVAALICREGRFLICRRPAHKARGLLWEFVGGKVEPGETKAQALARECREELAVEVDVGAPFMEVTHAYPDITVHLTLLWAQIRSGEVRLLEHCDMRWITPDEIGQFAFCPADEEILRRIEREFPRKKA
ncbi:MAG TPA: (deoxy)nucleoside triphosphate pyrophosphohydrolase [Candidatus Ruthenibacterium merdigallinarum]|nr:(deoxy)nucleoside triphosphate pyrophosphohydrolase [Candidatus Ruthenibacterium merdigallinarum]